MTNENRLTAFTTRLKWFLLDRRYAGRLEQPPLSGHYWTGTTTKAEEIKDISSKGLYLLTVARWHPGAMFSMALQRTDIEYGAPNSWIAVDAMVIRQGVDGVGVQFVPSKTGVAYAGKVEASASRKALKQFFKQLRGGRPPERD